MVCHRMNRITGIKTRGNRNERNERSNKMIYKGRKQLKTFFVLEAIHSVEVKIHLLSDLHTS